MRERRHYKPGDTFRWDGYEVEAVEDDNSGCYGCIGRLHRTICDALPTGCNNDEIIWKPNNDAASLMVVILKLEGNTVND